MIITSQPAFSPEPARLYYLLLFFFFGSAGIYAQTVTGKVNDAGNKPVPDVTVSVKGTTRATATNSTGDFSIYATGTETLVFTSVGFVRQEVPVNGRTFLPIVFVRGDETMDDVIVIALDIRKDSKKLGYAVTSVKTDELVTNRTKNVMESLEGRVAGLNITPPAAGAGASNQIRLRGQVGFAGADSSPHFRNHAATA